MRPAATLKGVPVAMNAPMAGSAFRVEGIYTIDRETLNPKQAHGTQFTLFLRIMRMPCRGRTAGPLKPWTKAMRPAATLKGVPVAVNAPMAGRCAAARPPYSICWMPTHTPTRSPEAGPCAWGKFHLTQDVKRAA